ncbi:WhiB family transcriptional regulator [Microbacterium sp. NPDC087868]|uniref:WhiB family transcriptional regulator n=1 Tax=Microbacterium sp. NPDC087868 TaxID=3364195 RepID=UPI00384AB81D
MEDTAPVCDGLETFTRDKFVDPEELAMMRGVCAECPLSDVCAAFAAAGRPASEMWAGVLPSERNGGTPGIFTR